MKILMIDDSKFVYAVVQDICNQLNWKLTWVQNGEDGVAEISKNTDYDIILLDWNMPILDGMGFLKKYKERYSNYPVPVIMMTTENSPEKIGHAVDYGVSEYIMKPFTLDIIQFKITTVMQSLGKAI